MYVIKTLYCWVEMGFGAYCCDSLFLMREGELIDY